MKEIVDFNNFGQHDMYEVSEHHIPIIPEELFEMAQKVRADRTNVEKDEIGNTQRKAKKILRLARK